MMKIQTTKRNWLLDAAIYTAFLASFWLILTGIGVHQWLGAITALAIGLHLFLHWNWVKSVSSRFFGRTSKQARVYYLVDILLLTGFSLILISGLVISTWFSLSLSQPAFWINIHSLVSIFSLLILLIKIGFHWRWININACKILQIRVPQPSSGLNPNSADLRAQQERRAFLKLMGVTSAAAFLSVAGILIPEPLSTRGDHSTNQASTSTNSTTTCSFRCDRTCSFPGRCRKYVDKDDNTLCDLGECL